MNLKLQKILYQAAYCLIQFNNYQIDHTYFAGQIAYQYAAKFKAKFIECKYYQQLIQRKLIELNSTIENILKNDQAVIISQQQNCWLLIASRLNVSIIKVSLAKNYTINLIKQAANLGHLPQVSRKKPLKISGMIRLLFVEY